jgi:hypothetical protein
LANKEGAMAEEPNVSRVNDKSFTQQKGAAV